MIELFLYMALYVLFIIVGAAIINGIFITTRGDTVVSPDGNLRDQDDMIFYPFYKFIMRHDPNGKIIYYQGEQLRAVYIDLVNNYGLPEAACVDEEAIIFNRPDIADTSSISPIGIWTKYAPKHIASKEIKMQVVHLSEQYFVRFYKAYPVYKFSKYVRKPLVECLKCMSSFWGTVLWWPVVLFIFGYYPVQVPLWIGYVFSLSYFNTLLFYKAK